MKSSIGTASIAILVVGACFAGAQAQKPGDGKNTRDENARAVTQVKSGPTPMDPRALEMASLADKFRDRGVQVVPDPAAPPWMLAMYQDSCDLYNAQLPATPEDRQNHFRYLIDNGFRINGWYGSIVKIAEEDGRTFVEMRFSPHVSSMFATVTFVEDSYGEFYELRDGTFHFLRGEEQVNQTGGIIFGD